MYQADTEILFPMRVTPELRDLRGLAWGKLVEEICANPPDSPSGLAFNLLLIRISGCLSCHTYSYRAMRGCTNCAIHAIKRFPGTDEELLLLYQNSLQEIQSHFQLALPIEP
jgi:hypothetical protein